jgi:hypothetical protein
MNFVFHHIFNREGPTALTALEKDVKRFPEQDNMPTMRGKMHC